ncbi:MAG: relaxase/mobilization nuclease domain-containing protein [Chromatiaceae bacterium]|nr:relaxase/mobilization nuclease domain-containing protein [Chromatiaceae bacterium]
MIPYASQRGLGQDLAAHLQNTHDNEYMEVAEVRGAIAQDLHGAFAEWEAQAHALTKCDNYLYSLSINPDPAQGPLTRDQYSDYIDRAEQKLGLSGQPRAVVFHIKDGREHCHVVWSRIDPFKEKAVHLAFDKDKLMMVTREFARDHDLTLPDGYYKDRDRDKPDQVSVYDMAQQRASGLTKADHIEAVTDAWRASDNAKAFVQALAEKGYMLATGKRPYVLVDFYGGMHSLPKMIGDKAIRTNDIRAFLGKDYPPEDLPSVDEAKALIAIHRKSVEAHLKFEERATAREELKRAQKLRREKQEKEAAGLRAQQRQERQELEREHRTARDALRREYLARQRQIRLERERRKPKGLAAFLGRVSGVELIRRKLHHYQDKKRLQVHVQARSALKDNQVREVRDLSHRHDLRSLDMQRAMRALSQIEKKEIRSLEEAQLQQARVAQRGGKNRMPSLSFELKPRGRKAVPHKAMNRHTSQMAREQFIRAQKGKITQREIDLTGEFGDAAEGGGAGGSGRSTSDGPKPASATKIRRYGRKQDKGKDFDKGR